MRRRFALLLTAALTAATTVVGVGPGPAGAQLVTDQAFSGYSTGSAISLNALTLGSTTIAGLHSAFSGSSVNSQGMGAPIVDEFGQSVQPPLPDDNSYGRGTGIEVGVAVSNPQPVDVNTLLLTGLAQAAAPPPTDLVTKTIPLNLPGVLSADVLRGQAQAIFDANSCVLGQPLSYGLGETAGLALVGTPGTALVDTTGGGSNAIQSRSYEYLIPNGDGTFGLVSETRQFFAPIRVNLGGINLLTIEVVGELMLRSTATGKPGGATIEYSDPLLRITALGGVVLLNQPLSTITLPVINLGGLANIAVAERPRAVGGASGSAPTQAADGTVASAAVDAVGRIQVLGTTVDLGIGHLQSVARVPSGGIRCTIPVAKTATPNPATVGDTVTWTVSIPADPAVFARLFACDLLNISATDTHSVRSGNPRFQLTGASNGGVINGNTVTWANLGNYVRGSPPIVLTITGRILGGSGVLQDIVNVTATLGNCTGGAAGQDIAGRAQFTAFGVPGSVTLIGPEVGRGSLSATGGDSRYLVLGGFLMLGALELRRRIRRRPDEATTSA